jgi:copper chaperone CopZ
MKTIFIALSLFFCIETYAATKIKVSGMSCPACAEKVETALKKIPAIKTVKSNFITGNTQITLNENKSLDKAKIIKAITDLGYKVVL